MTEYSVLGDRWPEGSEEQLESNTAWRLYRTRPIREYFADFQEKIEGVA